MIYQSIWKDISQCFHHIENGPLLCTVDRLFLLLLLLLLLLLFF